MGEVFYNDNEPFAAAWLRALVKEGHLPQGTVDDRSIVDINDAPDTAHFFAGIGGWPLALRLAGWPDDRPVWTGSCPCQPFSQAGNRKGKKDKRHLWPEFRRLIKKRLADQRPVPTIFGEQVASKDGRLWLAGVRADLEALGYEVGSADLCAAGIGAPHIRQRLFWVAHAPGTGWQGGISQRQQTGAESACGCGAVRMADTGGAERDGRSQQERRCGLLPDASVCRATGGMADANGDGGRCDQPQRRPEGGIIDGRSGPGACGMADARHVGSSEHGHEPGQRPTPGPSHGAEPHGGNFRLADADASQSWRRIEGFEGEAGIRGNRPPDAGASCGALGGLADAQGRGFSVMWGPDFPWVIRHVDGGGPPDWLAHTDGVRGLSPAGQQPQHDEEFAALRMEHAYCAGCGEYGRPGAVSSQQFCPECAGRSGGPWDQFTVVPCADGKARRIKPGLPPLVAGFPGRVGALRGYGNAIVPALAAEFIRAFMELRL